MLYLNNLLRHPLSTALTSLCIAFSWSAPAAACIHNVYGLGELEKRAEVIVKAAAIETGLVDSTLKPGDKEFPLMRSRFRVISLLKGSVAGSEFTLLHRGEPSNTKGFAYFCWPSEVAYTFTPGQSYLLLLKHGEGDGLIPIWKDGNDRTVNNPGSFPALTAAPVTGTFHGVLLAQMSEQISRGEAEQAIAMIDQVVSLSRLHWIQPSDDAFTDSEATHALLLGIHHTEERVRAAALFRLAAIETWLTIDSPGGFGLGCHDAKTFAGRMLPPNAKAEVAGSLEALRSLAFAPSSSSTVRTSAILILGGVSHATGILEKASESPDPLLRAAAAVALRYDTKSQLARYERLSKDSSAVVRKAVVAAIGEAGDAELLQVFTPLLFDEDAAVRKTATHCLLRFSDKPAGVSLLQQLKTQSQDFNPLIENALAKAAPAVSVPALLRIIREKRQEVPGSGGTIAWFKSVDILIAYLKTCGPDYWQSAEGQEVSRTLGSFVVEMSSGPAVSIYAMLIKAGQQEAASKFRAANSQYATMLKRVEDEGPDRFLANVDPK